MWCWFKRRIKNILVENNTFVYEVLFLLMSSYLWCKIILEYDKLTADGVYGWDFDNLEPNEEIQKYMREYLKIEDVEDDWVEDDEEYDIEDEDISDEQYDIFMEKMEDVFIDINNIFSNVNDIEHNINYYFPNEFELKEEIFSLLKEIEEKTDTMAEKIMKLVNYME